MDFIQDAEDAVEISLENLRKLDHDVSTPDDYADYLTYVLLQERDMRNALYEEHGTGHRNAGLWINENGCVHQFGIGGSPLLC